ncbi:MAG: IS1634 family transposase [Gemmatimonadaceae bacterium]|nr:IS1634 family transposase [Actinomycetota bacterium]
MNEHVKIPPIESYDIDHLGIVAGIMDETGLIEQIDHLLGTHEQEHLSSGQLIKAMILNGLGFVSAPLYLFQEFFEGKATEHLIAPGVKPEHLNDDKLGRVLDKLFYADLTKVFVSCAMKAASRYGVLERSSSLHLDSTSFHLHGDYETEREEEEPEAAISITHGYSRDQRPDLKQFIVDLMVSGEGDIPLFFRIADGNEADKAVFAQLLQDFRSQVDLDALFVADSALYSADSLKQMSDLKWLTRVPLTLAEAKRVLSEIEEDAFEESALSGYRLAEVSSTYAGIPQRWLIVESEARRQAASEQMDRRLLKLEKQLQKRLKKLEKEDFECEADALRAASTFAKELYHHKLTELRLKSGLRHDKPGRPAADASPRKVYSVEASLERDEAALTKAHQRSGRFILATNLVVVLGEEEKRYTNDELLKEYKAQQSAERGFRFLKDPLFFTSSIFVKTPERVAALAMVMGLCLLVYTLGQRALREALQAAGAKIRHQTGKQTARPTLRWVFQLFQAVHLLRIGEVKQISNLSEERATILSFLGQSVQRYYLLL